MSTLAVPPEVTAALTEFRTTEFATVTRRGVPVAVQVSALWRPELGTFLVTTGIGFPYKAYNVRRNSAVSLLFSNSTGSGLTDPPAVLVEGDATVSELTTWDDDLAQYWPWLMARQPISASRSFGVGARLVMPWYYQRLKIDIVPRRVRWWSGRDMSVEPRELELHEAAAGASPGRPTPTGGTPDAARADETSVASEVTASKRLAQMLPRFSTPRLTVLDSSGRPASVLCPTVQGRSGGFDVVVPGWLDAQPGPASLMSHRHDAGLWKLGGYMVKGSLSRDGATWTFRPSHYTDTGQNTPAATMAMIVRTRRAAHRYLERRKTPPPPTPWATIAEVRARVRRAAKSGRI